jgi:hypothetical protein
VKESRAVFNPQCAGFVFLLLDVWEPLTGWQIYCRMRIEDWNGRRVKG